MERDCVRVNPHFLLDGSPETSAAVQTVSRPLSHALFSSKKIRLFGPLGATIPLRELTIGPGDHLPASNGPNAQANQLQNQLPWLPDHGATTFYTPYIPEDLSAIQLEIILQFHRFVHGYPVPFIDQHLVPRILTVHDQVPTPSTAFDETARRYTYQGWTRAHFVDFFNEYCAGKVTACVLMGDMGLDVGEWMNTLPPAGMRCEDWAQMLREIGSLDNIVTDEEMGDVFVGVGEYADLREREVRALVEGRMVKETRAGRRRVRKGEEEDDHEV
ncbi:hypothetical protein MaudCBS49596_007125 [Microsporum audouinii]